MRANPSKTPGTIISEVVPTEYDIERPVMTVFLPSLIPSLPGVPVLRLPRIVLIDDHGRRFAGFTMKSAFRRAEKVQNHAGPIQHNPSSSVSEPQGCAAAMSTTFLTPTVITRTPTDQIAMIDLIQFIDRTVAVTVHDGARHIQNGPRRWAGTISSVFQHDPNGKNRYAGDGFMRFNNGSTAQWSCHNLVTVKLIKSDNSESEQSS